MESIINTGNNYKIASYQEKLPNNAVRCTLCPHNCTIHEGKTGICKVRNNQQGELFTTTYGNPCSLSIDPIEKKPLYHFLPGTEILSLATAGCNFRCLNCQNSGISQTSPDKIQYYDLSPENIVQQALVHNTESIAFTYTEPTVFYEYMFDTAKIAHQNGIKTVLVSNGFINSEPLNALCNYIDGANIDLKSMDNDIYRKLTGGSLQPVLDTILTLKDNKVWVEVTNLLIPGFSDNRRSIEKLCHWMIDAGLENVPVHFSRFYPSYKLMDVPPTPLESLELAYKIACEAGIKYVYLGNVQNYGAENTHCPHCNQLLVERHRYKISQNLIQNGKCPSCGEIIAGVWK